MAANLPLQHTFTMIIAAPSRGGKTHFVAKLLRESNQMIQPSPQEIYYCYTQYQPLFDSMRGVHFHQGMIDIETIDSSKRNLLILDDLMQEVDENVEKMFTRDSHHRNLSVIFLTQNLYQKNRFMRTMSLNASYIVLFRNPRDINQIGVLARQMYSKNSSFLIDAFRDATAVPYGYILVDLRQETPDLLRVRTGIFQDEHAYIYLPKRETLSLQRYTNQSKDHVKKT